MPLSPLRYPGSKRKLRPLLRTLLPENVPLLVEPFCGGASVTLRLLQEGRVERAVIADADPLVGAFWETVCGDAEEFADAIRREPVTLQNRLAWQATEPVSRLDRAMKMLFLNRTGFGGSVASDTIGVVGGRARAAVPGCLDSHFPADVLAERVLAIGAFAAQGRLEARCADWRDTMRDADADAVFFLDPPYWGTTKHTRMYRYVFEESDHRDLAKALLVEERPWWLSYDDRPEVLDMYRSEHVSVSRPGITYTAMGKAEAVAPGTEVLLSNVAAWRSALRDTPAAMQTLRLRDDLLAGLAGKTSRSESLRGVVERLANEGLPVQQQSERRRTQVSFRADPTVVERARAEAARRGMTLAEAVERLLESG